MEAVGGRAMGRGKRGLPGSITGQVACRTADRRDVVLKQQCIIFSVGIETVILLVPLHRNPIQKAYPRIPPRPGFHASHGLMSGIW